MGLLLKDSRTDLGVMIRMWVGDGEDGRNWGNAEGKGRRNGSGEGGCGLE